MPARWNRSRSEAVIALLLAAGMIGGGAALVLFLATISPGYSGPDAVPSKAAAAHDARYAPAVQEAQRLARALVVEANLPALSIAVARDGSLAWAEAFGLADVGAKTPATPRTRFRIGSVGRPMTAAAIALLHERGQVDLDAPVQRYVPSYPEKQWPVSVRQALADIAGIHHIVEGQERMPAGHCESAVDALRTFRDDPLAFEPGTEYRYSTYGWILLSALVEHVTGEHHARYLTREVFEPAGMRDTVLDGDDVPGRASFYFPRTAQDTAWGIEYAPLVDYSCYAGAGAWLSTPTDLARFGLAMLEPGLLQADTLALLQTPVRLESGTSSGFALGWKVETVRLAGTPVRMVAHRASSMGGTTSLLTFPDRGLVVAAVSNVSFASGLAPLAAQIAEAFSGPLGAR